MMAFLTPRSYRLNTLESTTPALFSMADASPTMDALRSHSQHPDFGHLTLLVFEAVLEVVCVSLPGYILARQGMLDAEAQKFLANLNVNLFTPALIFHKLASQLTADKLVDLAIIPLIFVVQTAVSYLCARIVSRICGFKERARNFVTAMAVFGNSNSLPISLVISLSKTLKGLHWDKVPGDNDNEVAARGILYLLIFQQLGQLVRWSWGYNVLLKPADAYEDEDESEQARIERGGYSDEIGNLVEVEDDSCPPSREDSSQDLSATIVSTSDYGSGTNTPYKHGQYDSSTGSSSYASSAYEGVLPTPANGNISGRGPGNPVVNRSNSHMVSFPNPEDETEHTSKGFKSAWVSTKDGLRKAASTSSEAISKTSRGLFSSLPIPLQKFLSTMTGYVAGFFKGLWSFMNPPLWAMLCAIIVASIPPLQHLFFNKGSFIENSVTRAIGQSGGVAVPLILVVLGANLARNTLPKEEQENPEDPKLERKILIASLISRMLLPTLIMAPMLALTAKFIPVSIVDDKIFIIVCFLLTGAPSALQLAQICQINNVYMGAMSKLLFQSYVVWILPSTLMLVMLALETVEWATA